MSDNIESLREYLKEYSVSLQKRLAARMQKGEISGEEAVSEYLYDRHRNEVFDALVDAAAHKPKPSAFIFDKNNVKVVKL